ncbi:MAG: TrkH family potassium uptake protein [Patescibacteria group bacterium]
MLANFQVNTTRLLNFIVQVLIPSLQIQLSLVLGFGFSLVVSLFYYFVNDQRYPQERPELLLLGLSISSILSFAGWITAKHTQVSNKSDLRRGAWIVVIGWFIACSTSAFVYLMAGFPDPENLNNYSLFSRLIDCFYESFSGFATVGTSILPSVEVFPRGVLMWRSITHLIGGIGIAYLAIVIIKEFSVTRSEIINSEVETPFQLEYRTESEAIRSGLKFGYIYTILLVSLFGLLLLSGTFFRATPYQYWYDNVYDALNFSISTIATGGFAVYDNSVGLPQKVNGFQIIGGLQNVASEWIIAVFMIFSSINYGLWFLALHKRRFEPIKKSIELKVFLIFVLLTTASIALILYRYDNFQNIWDNLRYAFFNVATIVSTAGLANQDFTKWPVEALGVLFSCYLVGGMMGSTTGGLKFHRFIVLYRYARLQLINLIYGKNRSTFEVDGIRYNDHTAGVVVVNMMFFYMLFMCGSILLMLSSSAVKLADGSFQSINLETAFTASLANLAGIGPAAVTGVANAGPVGNYAAFSDLAKMMLIVLMFVGRIGALSVAMLFITPRGQYRIANTLGSNDVHDDADDVFFNL